MGMLQDSACKGSRCRVAAWSVMCLCMCVCAAGWAVCQGEGGGGRDLPPHRAVGAGSPNRQPAGAGEAAGP